MRIEQKSWTERRGWVQSAGLPGTTAQLVLAFGARAAIEREASWAELRRYWPQARIVGCSTAGEIAGTTVQDDSIVATALAFERSRAECVEVCLAEVGGSTAAGAALAAKLDPRGLRHVFVLSEGLRVKGSELVRGLVEGLPRGVAVTGGLSADGSHFGRTRVALDQLAPAERVVGVGFYGDLRVGFGSLGGWDVFGPERLVTRARGATLYELDGQPALELYERYLGAHAARLPASGLLFPLMVRRGQARGVVRTILAVNRREQALTFAGDIPEGAYAQLMHANFDRLIEGASGAARNCDDGLLAAPPEIALLVSCVGRKLVLQQRIEEEVEAVRSVLGASPILAGFYSYGEIAPFTQGACCDLHNQTMTITTLREI